jgi:hypothetical protein
MKAKLLIGIALFVVMFGWRSDAQTDVAPTISTNWITAAENFREVNGQLYNTERSVLWTGFQGECLEVLTNAIAISTFTIEPIYQAATTTEYVPTGEFSPDKPVLVATKVQVGEKKVPGRKIILHNYPANLYAAAGQTISFRAIKVGTSNYKGDTLELWDYGTPHVVMVVTTNYPPQLKADKK